MDGRIPPGMHEGPGPPPNYPSDPQVGTMSQAMNPMMEWEGGGAPSMYSGDGARQMTDRNPNDELRSTVAWSAVQGEKYGDMSADRYSYGKRKFESGLDMMGLRHSEGVDGAWGMDQRPKMQKKIGRENFRSKERELWGRAKRLGVGWKLPGSMPKPSGMDGLKSGMAGKEPFDRRETHKASEQRRRDRLNAGLASLKDLIGRGQEENTSKLDKVAVLHKTESCILELHEIVLDSHDLMVSIVDDNERLHAELKRLEFGQQGCSNGDDMGADQPGYNNYDHDQGNTQHHSAAAAAAAAAADEYKYMPPEQQQSAYQGPKLASPPDHDSTSITASTTASTSTGAGDKAAQDPVLLYIDDDEFSRMIIGRILEQLGYSCLMAASGEEGLKILNEKKTKFDAVLLDIFMPGINGLEVLNFMKRNPQLSKIPVIMITSDVDKVSISLELGAEDYLIKPVVHPMMIKSRLNAAFKKNKLGALEQTAALEQTTTVVS